MAVYQHTQPGTLVRALMGVVLALFGALTVGAFMDGSTEVAFAFLLGDSLMVLVLLVFHSLHIEVTDRAVSASFGIGWVKKSIPMEQVVGCRRVKSRWWYGWGIRWIPNGWMYNVSGLDAVELQLASGRVFWLGTDDSDGLYKAVESAMPNRPEPSDSNSDRS
jgi:hypothetical protein